MPLANITSATRETYENITNDFIAKGYKPLSSGLPAGDYTGIIDDVEEFISMSTYDKPNGKDKGGVMFAIRATISINGGEAYKVYGFEESGAKKLLVTKDQLKNLEPGCSFSFTVTDKGYTSKVTVVKNDAVSEITEAIISAMTKPQLEELATKENIDIATLNAKQAREKLINELI